MASKHDKHDKKHAKKEAVRSRDTRDENREEIESETSSKDADQNPPRTTTGGWLTTPKFGSSTSGGGEIEPGPERD